MQSLDRAGVVVHCGTFSKTMLSALRLAYVVVPPSLVDPFTAALSIVARYTPLALQEPLADFIEEGHLDRHVRRMRRIYAERRAALIDALEAELGDGVERVGASAGLELLVRLPRGVDDVAVAREARALQLEMLPLSRYCAKRPSRGGLVLGFAGVPPRAMRAAVARLKTAIDRAMLRFPARST
jgi:GntR family transcriptional regulator/MocR family aminotransferase